MGEFLERANLAQTRWRNAVFLPLETDLFQRDELVSGLVLCLVDDSVRTLAYFLATLVIAQILNASLSTFFTQQFKPYVFYKLNFLT